MAGMSVSGDIYVPSAEEDEDAGSTLDEPISATVGKALSALAYGSTGCRTSRPPSLLSRTEERREGDTAQVLLRDRASRGKEVSST